MQLAHLKVGVQSYNEARVALRQAEMQVEEMVKMMEKRDISFVNQKKLYLEQSLIYQMLAKISIHL